MPRIVTLIVSVTFFIFALVTRRQPWANPGVVAALAIPASFLLACLVYGGYWLGRKFRLAHPGPNLRMAALAAHAIGAALAILVLVFSFYLFVTQPEQIGDTLARVQFVGVVLLECWFLYGLGRGIRFMLGS